MTALEEKSLPSRGAWIEIAWRAVWVPWDWSLPSRGAWIEIEWTCAVYRRGNVAPLTGSVD